MDEATFWRVIEESRGTSIDSRSGLQERQIEALDITLRAMPVDDVRSFAEMFWERMDEVYDWNLWAAANLVGDGCSDDAFGDFRAWLISMGRECYERAKEDADSLSTLVGDERVEDFFFEQFQYLPGQVFESLTGKPLPLRKDSAPMVPSGQRWANTAELKRRLPRLVAALASSAGRA